MRSRRAHSGGFTLLELILVMVIVCVMMAMAATSLRGFWAGRRTDDAASQLLAVTHWARSQAATDGRLYRLNIDPRAGTYWLTVQQQEQFVELGQEFGRVFKVPDDVRLELSRTDSADCGYIGFRPDGRTDPAILRIVDARGEEMRLGCESPTEGFRVMDAAEKNP